METRCDQNSFQYLRCKSKCKAKLEEAEAPCFMKNASASGSSKNQMLPSSLPLLASFFKLLPLPQKISRSSASTSLITASKSN